MLPASTRFKLHSGPYRTPRLKRGAIVEDEIRGDVTIVGLTDARIPWPIARKGKYRALLVEKTLAGAIGRESVQAVAYWWGISVETVRIYRRALGVPARNAGTKWLERRYAQTPEFRQMARKAWANAGGAERRATVSKVQRGRIHFEATRRKIAAANRRRVITKELRRRRSEAAKRCGAWPPAAGRPWTAHEDKFARTLSPAEVATRTGRTLQAVWFRRRTLGVASTNGSPRATDRRWTPDEENIAAGLPVPEAAKQLGRTQASILSRRSLLRTKKRRLSGRGSTMTRRENPLMKRSSFRIQSPLISSLSLKGR